MPITGVHGSYHGEPQLTSLHHRLSEALDACDDGRTLPTTAYSDVFERDYRLRNRWMRGEIITGPNGKQFAVEQTDMNGKVEALSVDIDGMLVAGWAREPPQRPAQTVVAFLDGQYLGYGACGTARPDVARAIAPSLNYSGFQFRFQLDPSIVGKKRPRLFALSDDGKAAELNYTF
jgi:hypothetical protein